MVILAYVFQSDDKQVDPGRHYNPRGGRVRRSSLLEILQLSSRIGYFLTVDTCTENAHWRYP